MSRHVFYCRCGARLEGSSAHLLHRCEFHPPATAAEPPTPDPDEKGKHQNADLFHDHMYRPKRSTRITD